MDRQTMIQRSVDSLERLFAVVVALAITIAIQKLLFDAQGNLHAWFDPNTNEYVLLDILLDRLPAMLAFVFSMVPFYHGMNRHLDRVYVERNVPAAKEGYLVIDFFVFFLESCLLVAFASLIHSGDTAFIILVFLLTLDALWCFATHGIHYGAVTPSTIRWGWINSAAVVLILLFYFSNIFTAGATRSWALATVAMIRTFADYMICWRFYFPPEPAPNP